MLSFNYFYTQFVFTQMVHSMCMWRFLFLFNCPVFWRLLRLDWVKRRTFGDWWMLFLVSKSTEGNLCNLCVCTCNVQCVLTYCFVLYRVQKFCQCYMQPTKKAKRRQGWILRSVYLLPWWRLWCRPEDHFIFTLWPCHLQCMQESVLFAAIEIIACFHTKRVEVETCSSFS